MALVLFIILLMAIAAYIFSRNVALRKTGFFGGIIIMLTLCYCLYLANESAALALSHESAVVIAPSTQLGSAPRASRGQNDKIVTIHEGTRVEIVDSVSTPDDPVSPKWYNVKINNTTKAWLRSSDVERI